jgi:hypothetical protein
MSTMLFLQTDVFLICMCLLAIVYGHETFTEEYRTTEDDTGREMTVSARGRLQTIIDLDDQTIVAVSLTIID